MEPSSFQRILAKARFWAGPAAFVGYLGLMHYVWAKLQESPLVNEGQRPEALQDKLYRVFVEKKKNEKN